MKFQSPSPAIKKNVVFGLLCSVSILTSALPTLAQTVPTTDFSTSAASASAVLPESTAITVAFPASMVIDAKKNQDYPTTLILAQPLLDSAGRQLAAQGSPVSVRLHPVKDGAQVIAESLVIQGRTIPIQATSPVLPSRKVTLTSGNQQARELSPIGSRIGGGLFGGATGGSFVNFNQGTMIGSGIGAIAGLASEKSMQVVEIPQGSVYVLTLQAPVAIAASAPLPAAVQQSTPTPQFRFQTEQDYAAGLEKILQAYQRRELSQADALNIIRAANTYATTQLPTPLYPPTQQRQLISQVFGFVYSIDSSAPQASNGANAAQILF